MTDPTSPSDQGMTRSEEQLRVTTRSIPIGRAVLRKTVVVEQRTVTVEIRHEEVHLEVLPIDSPETVEDAARGAHLALPDLVLRREEIVITKRLVPVERVRLEVRPVTEQRSITADVRHEEIETTGDIAPM